MRVGDKVWVYLVGAWAKAIVVPQPKGFPSKRESVFVQLEDDDQDVYRYNKEWVKERSE